MSRGCRTLCTGCRGEEGFKGRGEKEKKIEQWIAVSSGH